MSLRRVRDGRLEDFFREPVVLIARQLMDAEISGEIGAGAGRGHARDQGHASEWCHPRPWERWVGEIGLLLTRMRQGSYLASFPGPRRRSEHAIVTVVLEA
jgi:putative transposase